MNVFNYTEKPFTAIHKTGFQPVKVFLHTVTTAKKMLVKMPFAPLQPLRHWLDHLDVQNREVARYLCQLIPAQCPFERDIKLFGCLLFHVPPLCKLNPLYNEVVALRFRAMCFLADECGEDISAYC